IAVLADLAALPLTLLLALTLTAQDTSVWSRDISPWLLVISSVLALAIFAAFRLYQAVFRFVSRRGLLMASLAVVIATICVAMIDLVFFSGVIPVNAIIVAGILMLL